MPIDEAESILYGMQGFLSTGNSVVPTRGFAHFASGMTISAAPSTRGLVEAVEIWRPEPGADDVVTCLGVDIFTTAADDLIELFRQRTRVEIEDGGGSMIAPDLVVGLWRPFVPESPDDEDGRYFHSILIAAPGYYSTPGDL
ncbi:hypothetical protein ACFXJ8_38320 [Nonomuraea sp. NPDC059194]|uniref:hypothetical protein n=1 Tax=Nonomuraea sp. NPDC059194 TaxID=3346764 RepID=UPI003687D4B4